MRLICENLRGPNFKYKAGPGADYQSMRSSREEEAAAIMAEVARLEQAAGQVAWFPRRHQANEPQGPTTRMNPS